MVGGRLMRIRKAIVAMTAGLVLVGGMTACGAQDGCYDDGERVSCGYDDDDREDDDDEGWGEDDD